MHAGRSLDVIVSAEIVRVRWLRLVEPERYAVGAVIGELVDAFCEPDLALPDVYALLTGAVGAIASAAAPQSLLPRFSLRLLEMLGLAPPLTTCVRCGAALEKGTVWLDAESGGIVDALCRERWRDLPELSESDLINLRALALPKERAGAASLVATPRAGAAVEELIAHHLGKRPKALAHLHGLGSA